MAPTNERYRWMRWASGASLAIGAGLLVVAVLQAVTGAAWLESPWTGMIGFWLIGYVLGLLERRQRTAPDASPPRG